MADVKWIKVYTDIFDISRKIKLIEQMAQGDTIIVIWFKLLLLAGKINDGGAIYVTQTIPYEIDGLAYELRREPNIVENALSVFEMFDMIERSNGFIYISSWEEYQNIEGLDKIREQNRLRKQKQRDKQRASTEVSQDSHGIVTGHVTGSHATDKEEEQEQESEPFIKEKQKEKTDCQQIVDMFNSICVSFPSVRSLSDARKKAIKARLNTYTVDDFKLCFENAESSSFLKGGNDRNWTANFDWLVKDSNMAKVLDGNYSNKAQAQSKPSKSSFDRNEFLNAALNRSYREPPKTAADDEGIRERMNALKEQLGINVK